MIDKPPAGTLYRLFITYTARTTTGREYLLRTVSTGSAENIYQQSVQQGFFL